MLGDGVAEHIQRWHKSHITGLWLIRNQNDVAAGEFSLAEASHEQAFHESSSDSE